MMIIASLFSWMLIALMPVINAHGQSAGVWATLCTANGFERVLVRDAVTSSSSETSSLETSNNHNGPSCPASQFSYHHDFAIQPASRLGQACLIKVRGDQPVLQSSYRKFRFPRAPPIVASFA